MSKLGIFLAGFLFVALATAYDLSFLDPSAPAQQNDSTTSSEGVRDSRRLFNRDRHLMRLTMISNRLNRLTNRLNLKLNRMTTTPRPTTSLSSITLPSITIPQLNLTNPTVPAIAVPAV